MAKIKLHGAIAAGRLAHYDPPEWKPPEEVTP
jgi:hypothetical protein